jgi:hypothetical protein
MEMKGNRKIRALYGPSEEDFFPSEDAGSASSPSDSVAAGKIVAFSQPLDAIAVGMQLVQVLPLLQQLSRQVSDLTAEVKVLKTFRSAVPRSDADDVGYLDAEGARKYLSMSKNTFEAHVYSAKVKIPRYRVGGKNFFKKKDLDLFVLTWEDKNLS